MKTLGRLNIKPEKVLKDDELKNLRGGTWYGACEVTCGTTVLVSGYGYGTTQQSAMDILSQTYSWCEDLWVICGDHF